MQEIAATSALVPVEDSPWLGRLARDLRGDRGIVRRVYQVPGAVVAVLVPEWAGRPGMPFVELCDLLRLPGRAPEDIQYFRWDRGVARLVTKAHGGTISARGRHRLQELTALMQPVYDLRSMVRYTLAAALRPGDTVAAEARGGRATVVSVSDDGIDLCFHDRPDTEVRLPQLIRIRFEDGTETEMPASMLMPYYGTVEAPATPREDRSAEESDSAVATPEPVSTAADRFVAQQRGWADWAVYDTAWERDVYDTHDRDDADREAAVRNRQALVAGPGAAKAGAGS
ncbi:hypothetical protein [Streptacidiphilus sp. EB103A]|uniref:hypothetical protein n=1 Tax=Streptacidiphilus sp. EB103A TaxID=3156275 RepID=UPI00351791E7